MSDLVEACLQNRFPTLSTLCDYGLDGRDGINPIELFEMYRNLVLTGDVTGEELENAMKTDTLKGVLGINVKSGYRKVDVR
jgi:hypothetical protein